MKSPQRRLMLGAALLAIVAAIASLAPATASPATSTRPVTLALMTVRISSTSDFANVGFVPGTIRSMRVTSNPAKVAVQQGSASVNVSGIPKKSATVEAEVLFEETSLSDPIGILVQKGKRGKATARITNHSASPFLVAEVTNSATSQSTNNLWVTRTRSQTFGARDASLPHADDRRLVLAFYYGWYGNASWSNPRLFDQPASGPYSAWNSEDVAAMSRQARSNGIDGFVVSWKGADKDGIQFGNVLNAAKQDGGVATIYLEALVANSNQTTSEAPERAVVKHWLEEALAYAGNPAFLRSGGVPVVFVYGQYRLPPADWAAIQSELAAAGTPVRIVGDGSYPAYRDVSWGTHLYAVNKLTSSQLYNWTHGREVALRAEAAVGNGGGPQLVAGTVSPGYDDTAAKEDQGLQGSKVERGANGERYQLTWDVMRDADPDWVLITSWNEYYEGTVVQPTVGYGDLALRQTAANSARFKA